MTTWISVDKPNLSFAGIPIKIIDGVLPDNEAVFIQDGKIVGRIIVDNLLEPPE